MKLKTFAIPVALAVALALPACGGDDGGNGGTDTAGTTTATGAVTGTTSAAEGDTGDEATGATGSEDDGAALAGEVPDPCALVGPDQLASIFGGDPGTGTLQAVVPDQRKVCFYDTGLILAVEVAENWEASIAALEASDAGTITEVSGIGEAAVWQDIGRGIGQFVALGPDYFVGVTIVTGGQAAAEEAAALMLGAL